MISIKYVLCILIDQCSASCGGGFRRKTRECVNNEISRLGRQLVFDNPCKQALDVVEECNKQLCPEWTEWGEWTTCSKSCSGGRRRKFRQCVDRVSGGQRSDTPYFLFFAKYEKFNGHTFPISGSTLDEFACTGDYESEEDCNTQACPYWTPWSDWTQCTKSCGGGQRSKVQGFCDVTFSFLHIFT